MKTFPINGTQYRRYQTQAELQASADFKTRTGNFLKELHALEAKYNVVMEDSYDGATLADLSQKGNYAEGVLCEWGSPSFGYNPR